MSDRCMHENLEIQEMRLNKVEPEYIDPYKLISPESVIRSAE